MNRRLEKRHKRQVARAKERVKLSEPDLRTPEQLKAAQEASRPASARRNGSTSHYSAPSVRNQTSAASRTMTKAEG